MSAIGAAADREKEKAGKFKNEIYNLLFEVVAVCM